jgi:hypothetical protein
MYTDYIISSAHFLTNHNYLNIFVTFTGTLISNSKIVMSNHRDMFFLFYKSKFMCSWASFVVIISFIACAKQKYICKCQYQLIRHRVVLGFNGRTPKNILSTVITLLLN